MSYSSRTAGARLALWPARFFCIGVLLTSSGCWDDPSRRHLLAPSESRRDLVGVETQYTNAQSFTAALPAGGTTTTIDFATKDDGTPLFVDQYYFSRLSLRGVEFVPVGGSLQP